MDYMVIVICFCSGLHFVTSQLASNISVEAGNTVVLTCSLNGSFTLPEWRGPPSLMLYAAQGSATLNPALSNLNRLQYASNNRDLTILNVQKSDEGEYKCAFAGFGDYTVTLVHLKVIQFPVNVWHGLSIAGVAGVVLCFLALIGTVILITVGQKGKIVGRNPGVLHIMVAVLVIVVILYSLIVGAFAVSKEDDCRECTKCDMNDCDNIFKLAIACIAMACSDFVVLIVLVIIRQVFFHQTTSSNT